MPNQGTEMEASFADIYIFTLPLLAQLENLETRRAEDIYKASGLFLLFHCAFGFVSAHQAPIPGFVDGTVSGLIGGGSTLQS